MSVACLEGFCHRILLGVGILPGPKSNGSYGERSIVRVTSLMIETPTNFSAGIELESGTKSSHVAGVR